MNWFKQFRSCTTSSGVGRFSFPEAIILLISTNNQHPLANPIFFACAEYSFCSFQPIRLSDFNESINRGLPVLEVARGRWFLVPTKRIVASGDENLVGSLPFNSAEFLIRLFTGSHFWHLVVKQSLHLLMYNVVIARAQTQEKSKNRFRAKDKFAAHNHRYRPLILYELLTSGVSLQVKHSPLYYNYKTKARYHSKHLITLAYHKRNSFSSNSST